MKRSIYSEICLDSARSGVFLTHSNFERNRNRYRSYREISFTLATTDNAVAVSQSGQPADPKANAQSGGNLEQARSERRRRVASTGAEEACRRSTECIPASIRIRNTGSYCQRARQPGLHWTAADAYIAAGARAPRSPRRTADAGESEPWPAREWLTVRRRVSRGLRHVRTHTYVYIHMHIYSCLLLSK